MPNSVKRMIPSAIHVPTVAGPDDYRWLVGGDAAPVLAALAEHTKVPAAEVARLRRTLSPVRTHLAIEQVELRRRARAKFAAAEQMFFKPRELEQASDEIVAGCKAQRFAGRREVFDLCTGIGGDLLALARVARATGFERDETNAVLAEANARLATRAGADAEDGRRAAQVEVCDVAGLDVGRAEAWHIDPDRRPSGRRTTRVELHEPGVEVIEALLAQNYNAAIKLAPAAVLPDAWTDAAELEWISRDRECRQLVAWFGGLTDDAGRRRATVLGNGAARPRTVVGVAQEEPPAVGRAGRYLLEPDAAVLAAGLAATLAAEHDLLPIAPGVAYWTADEPTDDRALVCFEVCDVMPLDIKRLKVHLRGRGFGRLEIKKRGVDVQPEQLRRQLALKGESAATLIVLPIGGRATAVVCRRV